MIKIQSASGDETEIDFRIFCERLADLIARHATDDWDLAWDRDSRLDFDARRERAYIDILRTNIARCLSDVDPRLMTLFFGNPLQLLERFYLEITGSPRVTITTLGQGSPTGQVVTVC